MGIFKGEINLYSEELKGKGLLCNGYIGWESAGV